MPRVKTSKAKFDTYNQGAKIDNPKIKKGYKIDRSKPRDENDTLFCKKGDIYYSWVFRYGGAHRSLIMPRASQLTQSDFLGRIYYVNEQIEDLTIDSFDDLESTRDEIVSELEQLRDEQEEKRGNMPEHLQDAPTGELLQTRYEEVDSMISELESLEFEIDDDLDDDSTQEAQSNILDEMQAIEYQGE